MNRPPVPPFTPESAAAKGRAAEDAWNTRDPARVALAYTPDSRWRNRAEFLAGRDAIIAFLTRKWTRELEYRLVKELWEFDPAGPVGWDPVTDPSPPAPPGRAAAGGRPGPA